MTRGLAARWIALYFVGMLLSVNVWAQATPPPAKKKPVEQKAPAAPPKLELEPKALEILKAASGRIAASHSVAFTAVELYESLSRQGVPLAYTTKYEVNLKRPDKLRVIMPADGPASDFYYDGKSIMALSPKEDLLAVADAPPTIEAALEKAFHLAAIYFPFTDLIVSDPYSEAQGGLTQAYYVGQSHVVGGMTTDIVAYVNEGVFGELWVGADDKLPRMVRVVFLDDPDLLRYEMVLSNWKLDEAVPPETFTPQDIATAKRIPFANPYQQPSAGVKALVKHKSSKDKN
jgi:hypothetical protein